MEYKINDWVVVHYPLLGDSTKEVHWIVGIVMGMTPSDEFGMIYEVDVVMNKFQEDLSNNVTRVGRRPSALAPKMQMYWIQQGDRFYKKGVDGVLVVNRIFPNGVTANNPKKHRIEFSREEMGAGLVNNFDYLNDTFESEFIGFAE